MATPEELLSRSVELIKSAYKQSKKQEANDEITAALMEVRENLQVVRESFAELKEAKTDLAARVADLEKSFASKHELVRHMGIYWKKGDPDPWCPNCWENQQRATHMNPTAVLAGRLRVCGVCNFDVNLDNVRPPAKWPKQ